MLFINVEFISYRRSGLTTRPTHTLFPLAAGAEVEDAEHVLSFCTWFLQLVQ